MRSLSTIAYEITRLWPKPYFGAVPYLRAMLSLDSCGDYYYHDSGHQIVLYFLSNAKSWKGSNARRIKAELRQHAGIK